jgi:putative Mn2+ efflux pump MntP
MELLTIYFIALGLSMDALAAGLGFSLLPVHIMIPVSIIGLKKLLEHLQGG